MKSYLLGNEMPKAIPGFDFCEILIINDGSTDRTVEVIKDNYPHVHILEFSENQGLGVAFRKGLEYALAQGADLIVNTDGDNQYLSYQIKDMVAPILSGQADVVIGDRQLHRISRYPKYKLFSQSLGNFIISLLYLKQVNDATSGFRAFNKKSANLLVSHLKNKYTYTVESLCML